MCLLRWLSARSDIQGLGRLVEILTSMMVNTVDDYHPDKTPTS
jgi:hypothetical protein